MIKSTRQGRSKASHAKLTAAKSTKMQLNVHRRRGGEEDWPEFRVPPSQAQPKAVFTSCHYCGYDPAVVPEDGLCPKCGGHSWERNAISVRLLPTAKKR